MWCCKSSVAPCMLQVARGMLHVASCALPVACATRPWLWHVACHLSVVCCLLHEGRSRLRCDGRRPVDSTGGRGGDDRPANQLRKACQLDACMSMPRSSGHDTGANVKPTTRSNMQRTRRNKQDATDEMQPATCERQQVTCSVQHVMDTIQCDVQHARCNIRQAAHSLQRATCGNTALRCTAGETPASASVATCCTALYRVAPRCIVLQCAAMCSNTAHGRRNSGERRVATRAERRVSARPRRRPTVIRSRAVTQLSLHGLCRSSDAPCERRAVLQHFATRYNAMQPDTTWRPPRLRRARTSSGRRTGTRRTA